MKPLLLALLIACASQYVAAKPLRVAGLRCDNLTEPISLDNTTPRLSWINLSDETGQQQTAYEIEIATTADLLQKGKADIWRSGKRMGSEQISVPIGGKPLQQRRQYSWRVRTWNRDGQRSAWSATAHFGVGILDEATFRGHFITPTDPLDQTPLLLKEIDLKTQPQQALMHVNSLGYHELYINGTRADNHVLQPAVSQLDRRSQIVTYDVAPLLRRGHNDILLWLGRGWYKPHTFHAQYPTPLVRADLDICHQGAWSTIAATDPSWQSCTTQAGACRDLGTWSPWEFIGERIDASRLLPDLAPATLHQATWTPVQEATVHGIKATPQLFPGNRIATPLTPTHTSQLPDGRCIIDFGRNTTGWFRAQFQGLQQGDSIRIEYADDLNDQGMPEGCNEHDIYLASGKPRETFTNHFHHHAFRYAILSGPLTPSRIQAQALPITADHPDHSTFTCSDPDLCAIHDMVQHTLRCLTFSGYMVDCPHIERQGYGGDGNSSTPTLQTMQDALPTYRNWIQAWADVQDTDGGMPHVAPTCRSDGGGPYWCGFIIMAPWRAWINYADDRMLTNHYHNMKHWLTYVAKYSPDGLLTRWPDTSNRIWYLGDWLTPQGINPNDQRSVTFVSNCFILECLEAMTHIATHLHQPQDSLHYSQWATHLRQQLHHTYYNPTDTTYASGSTLDMTYAMNLHLMPPADRQKIREKTIRLCRTRDRSHIAVGLLGIHVFTEWAIREEATELMYDILKQEDYPGYLHMLRHGATTTWESWDRSRSRIHNCYNGIGTWFYQALAGIRHTTAPHHYIINPQFPHRLQWARAQQHTPYGPLTVEWHHHPTHIQLRIHIPIGLTAHLRTPDGHEQPLPAGTTTLQLHI